MMNLIDFVVESTTKYVADLPKNQRKEYGQFFTSKETAIFMASLFELPKNQKEISILDPGAGTGILSTALIDRLQSVKSIETINLVCYENDPKVRDVLKTNLEWVCCHSSKTIRYKVINENYILDQKVAYSKKDNCDSSSEKYDFIIGNPPYRKIKSDSPEALAMPDICYGAPNLYFLFTSMSVFNLKPDHELVFIIPRSWTSGAYFKKFREKLLRQCVIQHIHMFIQRNAVFDKEDVLQETIIIKIRKSQNKPLAVKISTTLGNKDFAQKTLFDAPYATVANSKNSYIYLPINSNEVSILNTLNHWSHTLPTIGLKMRTGLTVDFRKKELLKEYEDSHSVPLFYPYHIRDGKINFPIGKGREYIGTNEMSLLQKNTNYLFVKRFTSKEERRRLQCGIYLASDFPSYSKISTENKLNFICGTKDLSENIVFGLYVLFNSTLYDLYYRILNGSTQVNSTEFNTIPVPSIEIIESLGNELMKKNDLSEAMCNEILRSFIHDEN